MAGLIVYGKIMYKKYIPYIIIVILIILYLERCGKTGDLQSINVALNDTLTITTDELGREKAKIAIIVGNSRRDLLKIQSKNKSIKALQAIVKANKGIVAATVLSNSTVGRITSNSTISGRDTVYLEGGIEIYPTYWTMFTDEWQDFNVFANKDTFDIEYKVFNKYDITQAYQKPKKGLFQRKVPMITVHNLNPHTQTNELKSFAIKPKPRKITLGVGVYGGFQLSNGQPAVIVGGGVQYNLR